MTGLLMGEYQHTLDTKQRLIIPAKFRDQLVSQFVVTRGLDGCLFGYPMSEWQLLEQKLKALPLTKRDARAFVRFLYSAATVCTFSTVVLPMARAGTLMIRRSRRSSRGLFSTQR